MSGSTPNVPENVRVNVIVSENKQKASISVDVHSESGTPLSVDLVMNALAAAGVVHGINTQDVRRIVALPKYKVTEQVAAATLPEKGADAKIKLLFSATSEAKPKEMENGQVDFKQLDIIKNVLAGDPVCEKTPPGKGTPGTDVMGNEIEPQAGRDVLFPAGQNTYVAEDGTQLLAKINGQVDYVGGRVIVMNSFEIKEDVDYKTGNIDFVGNVNIGGDVIAGFSVRADGNVFIKGCVDGGVVEARGNVTIVNGVNGQANGKVTCGGDLRCKFLQNANVDVDGNLETTSCVNSTVRVGGVAKFMGKQALLLASRLIAGQAVQVLNIGSRNSTVANIVEVGLNPRIAERLAQIPNEENKLKSNIDKLKRVIDLYKQLSAQNRLTDDKKAELDKFLATVQGSEDELERLKAEKEDLDERAKGLGYGTVTVLGTAYHGTQIVIGSEKKILNSDYQFTHFMRTPEGIKMVPAQK